MPRETQYAIHATLDGIASAPVIRLGGYDANNTIRSARAGGYVVTHVMSRPDVMGPSDWERVSLDQFGEIPFSLTGAN